MQRWRKICQKRETVEEMGSCRDGERFAKIEKLLEEMCSWRDLHGERFAQKERLLEEMGSCRDGERFAKKKLLHGFLFLGFMC